MQQILEDLQQRVEKLEADRVMMLEEIIRYQSRVKVLEQGVQA